MKFIRIVVLLFGVNFGLTPVANATLIPNPDGLRVYDTFLKVTWLADADLPATKVPPAGQPFYALLGFQTCDQTHLEPCIDTNGAMSYDTAQAWVQALNNYPGDGYLGHHKWTIPRVLASDPNCTIRNWAYNCTDSALGSLSGVDPATARFAVHDEYGRVQPSGPVTIAEDGTYSFTVALRTFVRANDTDGRLYTIHVSAADNAGNRRATETIVTARRLRTPPCKKNCI